MTSSTTKGQVYTLPGASLDHPHSPNERLVRVLEDALEMARSGNLRSFIGTGFTTENNRLSIWSFEEAGVYEMMGALAWLQHEYVDRVTDRIDRREDTP